jgi:hypothetical protein
VVTRLIFILILLVVVGCPAEGWPDDRAGRPPRRSWIARSIDEQKMCIRRYIIRLARARVNRKGDRASATAVESQNHCKKTFSRYVQINHAHLGSWPLGTPPRAAADIFLYL